MSTEAMYVEGLRIHVRELEEKVEKLVNTITDLVERLDDAYSDECPSHTDPRIGCGHCEWSLIR